MCLIREEEYNCANCNKQLNDLNIFEFDGEECNCYCEECFNKLKGDGLNGNG